MDIIEEYFKLLEEVYEYFGFKEDYVIFALEDRRDYEWVLIDDDVVQYGNREDILNDTGEYYEDEIYKQRFYNKWIYRGKDYTMIMVDTHTDGNKFLAVFDNKKEFKYEYY
jgi:hypothetical protein